MSSMSFPPQTIGHSCQGRPLTLHFTGSAQAANRVLVIAGQHGDERIARRAAERWLERFRGEDVHVAALLDANPDGACGRQRRNADGVDLNRDHQLLIAPETQAIHRFARQWKPNLIIDVHTYPPRREHLLAKGLVHANDVFIDIANNPTACHGTAWAKPLQDALPQWIVGVRERGFRCDRYTLITQSSRHTPCAATEAKTSPRRRTAQETVPATICVRHSTPDITDARNGLALSLGVPTVLLEGRERTRFDQRSAKRRTRDALTTALDIIVKEAPVRWPSVAVEPSDASVPTSLPIRSRYAENPHAHELDFFDATHQEVRRVRLPGPYQSRLTNSQVEPTAIAYAVPWRCDKLLEVLRRHGVKTGTVNLDQTRTVQTRVRRVESSPHALRPPRRLRTHRTEIEADLSAHQIIPVTATNARLLTALLEAHSKYGLCRYPHLGIYPQAGEPFAILRLEPAERAASCAVN